MDTITNATGGEENGAVAAVAVATSGEGTGGEESHGVPVDAVATGEEGTGNHIAPVATGDDSTVAASVVAWKYGEVDGLDIDPAYVCVTPLGNGEFG